MWPETPSHDSRASWWMYQGHVHHLSESTWPGMEDPWSEAGFPDFFPGILNIRWSGKIKADNHCSKLVNESCMGVGACLHMQKPGLETEGFFRCPKGWNTKQTKHVDVSSVLVRVASGCPGKIDSRRPAPLIPWKVTFTASSWNHLK